MIKRLLSALLVFSLIFSPSTPLWAQSSAGSLLGAGSERAGAQRAPTPKPTSGAIAQPRVTPVPVRSVKATPTTPPIAIEGSENEGVLIPQLMGPPTPRPVPPLAKEADFFLENFMISGYLDQGTSWELPITEILNPDCTPKNPNYEKFKHQGEHPIWALCEIYQFIQNFREPEWNSPESYYQLAAERVSRQEDRLEGNGQRTLEPEEGTLESAAEAVIGLGDNGPRFNYLAAALNYLYYYGLIKDPQVVAPTQALLDRLERFTSSKVDENRRFSKWKTPLEWLPVIVTGVLFAVSVWRLGRTARRNYKSPGTVTPVDKGSRIFGAISPKLAALMGSVDRRIALGSIIAGGWLTLEWHRRKVAEAPLIDLRAYNIVTRSHVMCQINWAVAKDIEGVPGGSGLSHDEYEMLFMAFKNLKGYYEEDHIDLVNTEILPENSYVAFKAEVKAHLAEVYGCPAFSPPKIDEVLSEKIAGGRDEVRMRTIELRKQALAAAAAKNSVKSGAPPAAPQAPKAPKAKGQER